jgi:two-component system sensor histidine kinase KdpD
MNERPNPDELLAQLKRVEHAAGRGNLKIFLGMAPGVGKTYAMLLVAQGRFDSGVDVVVGLVETHGRIETTALLSGLPYLPRQTVTHRGITLEEFDLDAALARRPKLILLDELAHTNAPGSRHPKRYQDVMELIDAGVDVFTTVNIQHLESRADAVREITGIQVQETVPDSILDAADEVELIDLSPEQLRQRLDEGKVYGGDRAKAATENFFREGNLTALREMALRSTAERVKRDVREVMAAENISAAWRTSEHLLVAVGPAPSSERLIRYARRMASTMDAPWIALHVESSQPLSEADKLRLEAHLDLARRLGAEVIATVGDDFAEAILRTARRNAVTQIIVGKPPKFSVRQRWGGNNLFDRLIRRSGEIDVSVVRAGREESRGPTSVEAQEKPPFRLREYGIALAIVAVVTALCWPLQDLMGFRAISMIYLFAVALAALVIGRGPVLVVATLSALLWDFLFLPPRFTLYVREVADGMMLAMYFVIAIVLGDLTSRLRARELAERRREERASALYRLTRELSASANLDAAFRAAADQIGGLFRAAISFFPADAENRLPTTPHPAGDPGVVSEKEFGVARWAFDNGRAAGRATDTLPESAALYLPLRTSRGVVGVMGVRLREARTLLLTERELLETCASQVAAVIERESLLRQARAAEAAETSERLQRTLFDSVSHELKTPLAVIASAADHLLSPLVSRNSETQASLLGEVQTAARRLEHTINNLLDISRLESGYFQPKLEYCDVRELVESAVATARGQMSQPSLQVSVEENLPPCRIDYALVETALLNLIFNAGGHGGHRSRIEVAAFQRDHELVLQVRDHGPGLPPDGTQKLFEKFHRGAGVATGGLGLGLSIVKRLAEAHDGRVSARNAEDGGAIFEMILPVVTLPPDSSPGGRTNNA